MGRLKRKGRCYDDSFNKFMSLDNPDAVLVHGLPLGRSGEAAKAGRFPHAWVELDDECWEPATKSWWPATAYYALGQIEYTVKYTRQEVGRMLMAQETYGPWDDVLLARDEEIEQEFG